MVMKLISKWPYVGWNTGSLNLHNLTDTRLVSEPDTSLLSCHYSSHNYVCIYVSSPWKYNFHLVTTIDRQHRHKTISVLTFLGQDAWQEHAFKITNIKVFKRLLSINFPSWIQLFVHIWFNYIENSLGHRNSDSNRSRYWFSCD